MPMGRGSQEAQNQHWTNLNCTVSTHVYNLCLDSMVMIHSGLANLFVRSNKIEGNNVSGRGALEKR